MKTVEKHAATIRKWTSALEGTDGDAFAHEPAPGAWKIGEVCDHVLEASRLFLDRAETLTRGEGEERGGGLFAALILMIGSLPPARLKVPEMPPELARLSNPECLDKDAARRGFDECERRIRSLAPVIAAAPKGLRSKHPVQGWFNAAGWLKLSEMHMRHHLRQLKRTLAALAEG